ncbi:MAG: polymerase X family protein [Candidatus Moranbacteria bacterium GW2011_GWE1_49_15]|nr:MAG: polymerase X family protein [Candidatus Moranbacteria bacterium GW2011_GWE2_47_10]KKW06487.1 MAG: polymerase X family protein [Candidatus Moranbacteria bacterium GW2011_GWE1_49_15]HBP01099.1 DNA polymerase/3'-5' exonuclease PolX [Candidatus Moranbacteria bacterium]
MNNQEISKILYEMAALSRMEGEDFKARAYEKVSQEIEGFGEQLSDIFEERGVAGLEELPGVGKNIAAHIADLIESGTFEEYKNLKRKIPVDILGLLEVEGVGPKNVKALWDNLRIRNLDDLEKAAKEKKIRDLPNFGEKTEEKILAGIEFVRKSGGRKVLGLVLPEIRTLEEKVKKFSGVERVVIAGSVRRRKETIGDVDILVVGRNPKKIMDQFVELPEVDHVIAKGGKKSSVALKLGINSDLRVFSEDEFGAALNYFTGSQAHNIRLRQIAKEKGMKLSEYGLFRGKKKIAGKTEEGIYKKLGLAYIEPELREDQGEIEAALEGNLPEIIGYGDLKGDLQIQTDWTDGHDSIWDMATYAMEKGLEYIVITDHTKDLAVTGGSDEKRLLEQMKEIDKLNERLKKEKKKFRILKGAETNILKDGSIDIDDNVLAKLDVVGAAIHKNFELSKKEQTERVVKAMRNPHVDIIFHLTTRVIGKRKGIELDVEKIIEVAKETGTVLEIDAFPDRLDIAGNHVKSCVEKGVRMSIDSDAHAKAHIDFLEHGIAEARRGWAQKGDIINANSVDEMLSMLKGKNQ